MTLEYLRYQYETSDILFVHDRIGESGWGLLRALPAIRYLGVEHFTFPKRWRQLETPAQYDYLDYTYELLGSIDLTGMSLCAITNQNYETHTEFTIKSLINRYTQCEEGPFVVVADRREFNPQGGQRPLREQPFTEDVGPYKNIYDTFSDHYRELGLEMPLVDTENLFMQDNANLYELVSGDRLRDTQTLLEVLPEAPYLPLYRAFASIFSRESEPGSSPLDSYAEIEGLARWLRRRIEWDRAPALEVARALNRKVSENERVFDSVQMTRHPTVEDAQEVARELESRRSDVHARYAAWLRGITP